MNDEQSASVMRKLVEIKAKMVRHDAEMKRLRSELIAHALFFDNYAEMYCFVKKHTPTLEDFNRDMLEARELWFKSRKE